MLARLILKNCSFDLGAGNPPGTSFLLDMNDVFEAFIHRSLLESLRLSETAFRRCSGFPLDEANRVGLEPDLSWWDGGKCIFVGDVKYKNLNSAQFKHADLYQLLAYTTAAQLHHGLLVYAAGESESATHRVPFAETDLVVAAVDLSGTPTTLLSEVGRIAELIRERQGFASAPAVGPSSWEAAIPTHSCGTKFE